MSRKLVLMPIAIDTIYEHNIGDFFISEGIISSLSFPSDTDFFVCKASSVKRQMVETSDICILPGTPAWLWTKEHILKNCIELNKKVYIFGAGSYNPDPESIIKTLNDNNLLKVYSVRDRYAQEQLSEYGAEIRICPSMHYFESIVNNSRNFGFVFQYEYHNKDLRVLDKESLLNLYNSIKSLGFNPIIICHTMEDYSNACAIFGKINNIFYSRYYPDYKKIYQSLSFCVGNRLHGILPSLSVGAFVFSLSLDARYEALDTVSSLISNVNNCFYNFRTDQTDLSNSQIVETIINWVNSLDIQSNYYTNYFNSIVRLKQEDRKYLSSLDLFS